MQYSVTFHLIIKAQSSFICELVVILDYDVNYLRPHAMSHDDGPIAVNRSNRRIVRFVCELIFVLDYDFHYLRYSRD